MRRGIFRGVLIWVLLSSILFSNASCKLDQKLYEVQICEDIKIVDIIEPKNIGESIL